MDRVNVELLPPEDAQTFSHIDREHPWLLTPREQSLLERLVREK